MPISTYHSTDLERPGRARALRLALASLLFVPGCDDGDDGHADEHTVVDPCDDPRVDDFMIGMTKEGDAVHVSILDASPSVPIRDDNAWTIGLTDPAGAPLENYEVRVQPWMPDHRHGVTVGFDTTDRGDGEVHIEPLHLHMAGLWEIRFHVTPEGEPEETVVITVCVD